MSFGIHFRGQFGVGFVFDVSVLCQERHGLHGESQHGFCAFFVEPFHEATLQPVQCGPGRFCAIREAEVAEDAFKIVGVVVGYVPKDGLEVSCAGGLVDGIDDLLEAVGDDFVDGAAVQGEVGGFVGAEIVVLAIFFSNEIAHIHQELRCGTGSREHGGDDEDHVHKAAAEGFEVARRRAVAANALCAVQQPGVHGDGGAVVCQRRFVVFIDEVVFEEIDVAVCRFFPIHFLDFVTEHSSVQSYESLFRQFCDECCDVFVLHVGVCVIF